MHDIVAKKGGKRKTYFARKQWNTWGNWGCRPKGEGTIQTRDGFVAIITLTQRRAAGFRARDWFSRRVPMGPYSYHYIYTVVYKGVCISRWPNKVSATRSFAIIGRQAQSHTVQYTIYCTVYCILHCTLYTTQCTILYSVQYNVWCTVYCTVYCVLYSTQYTIGIYWDL